MWFGAKANANVKINLIFKKNAMYLEIKLEKYEGQISVRLNNVLILKCVNFFVDVTAET